MMRKHILSLILFAVVSVALAQQKVSVKIWKGGNSTTIEQIDSVTFPNTTHQMVSVDLGLSVKWGACNVGAETPEAYGNYYAWGETGIKKVYNWEKYKYADAASATMTKYNSTDGKTILETNDDAATVVLGSTWRIPTTSEMKELVEKCTWKWQEDEENGHYGYWVTGPNGNRIFLPAGGCMNDDSHMQWDLMDIIGLHRSVLLMIGWHVICFSIIITSMAPMLVSGIMVSV